MHKNNSILEHIASDAEHSLSVYYHFTQEIPASSNVTVRLSESSFHRSAGYSCEGFYKPISRCLPPR